jgi:hypothetical protein
MPFTIYKLFFCTKQFLVFIYIHIIRNRKKNHLKIKLLLQYCSRSRVKNTHNVSLSGKMRRRSWIDILIVESPKDDLLLLEYLMCLYFFTSVKWKFVPHPIQLRRINFWKFRVSQSFHDCNVHLRYTQTPNCQRRLVCGTQNWPSLTNGAIWRTDLTVFESSHVEEQVGDWDYPWSKRWQS